MTECYMCKEPAATMMQYDEYDFYTSETITRNRPFCEKHIDLVFKMFAVTKVSPVETVSESLSQPL
jgi:hypothetical protein